MIVDDRHALAAILSYEADRARAQSEPGPVLYLDARVPAILHLRMMSALYKPTAGRMTQLLHATDVAQRTALLKVIASPRPGAVTVLDDRPLAAAIGTLTAAPGVSLPFAALIAHGVATGQPILSDPTNVGRWTAVAEARGAEVVTHPIDPGAACAMTTLRGGRGRLVPS